MSGPFPPMLHEKLRKYTQVFPQFFIFLNEKILVQNCFAPEKDPFSGCRIPTLQALRACFFFSAEKKQQAYPQLQTDGTKEREKKPALNAKISPA